MRAIATATTLSLICLLLNFPIEAQYVGPDDCYHVCAHPLCNVSAIDQYENGIGGCANFALTSHTNPGSTPASGTICEKGFGTSINETKVYLNCVNGDCNITGNFRCRTVNQNNQTVITKPPVGLSCPVRNLGGTNHTPEAAVQIDYAVCAYPDLSYWAMCDSTGRVSYGIIF